MADERDAHALKTEIIKALSELAGSSGSSIRDGDLQFCAGYLVGATDPRLATTDEDRRGRLEMIIKTAGPFMLALRALGDDEAEDLYADYNLDQALRLVWARATEYLEHRPPRTPGRKPKLTALGVASRALTVFEIITGRRATISVDAISETAGGPYLGLVTTAFRIFSIQANPEYYAKKAIRESRPSQKRSSAET